MTNIIFENTRLLRNNIIGWVIVLCFPLLWYAIINIVGGDFNLALLYLMMSPLVLYLIWHHVRTLRTNIVRISHRMNGAEVEIVVQSLSGKQVTYTGWKSEFEFHLIPDRWNKGHPFIDVWFRGEKIARQFHIMFRRHSIQKLAEVCGNAGIKVTTQ